MYNSSSLTEIVHFDTIFLFEYNQMLISEDILGELKDYLTCLNIINSIIITRFKYKILIRFFTISISR